MAAMMYEIVWTKRAQLQLKQAFEYICEDSPVNAKNVIEDIVNAVGLVSANPEMHSPDKYRTNNDGSYRAFEKHRYRISYRIRNTFIIVLRIRHTKREPKSY